MDFNVDKLATGDDDATHPAMIKINAQLRRWAKNDPDKLVSVQITEDELWIPVWR